MSVNECTNCGQDIPSDVNHCINLSCRKINAETPTLEQVAWLFEQINENAGGSFRNLIYDRLGFGPNAYSELYAAGGQNITNAMCVENHSGESKSDLIDSQIEQIEVLRPVYEAAKVMLGAWEFGTSLNYANARDGLKRDVDVAARELEDTDD